MNRAARLGLGNGAVHLPGYLDRAGQEALLAAIRAEARAAPFFTPRTDKPFSVRKTNLGPLG